MKRVGAVIKFAPQVTQQEAEEAILALRDKGLVVDSDVEEYEDYGGECGPVWYIP